MASRPCPQNGRGYLAHGARGVCDRPGDEDDLPDRAGAGCGLRDHVHVSGDGLRARVRAGGDVRDHLQSP